MANWTFDQTGLTFDTTQVTFDGSDFRPSPKLGLLVISIPTASWDGKFYGRYPIGDKMFITDTGLSAATFGQAYTGQLHVAGGVGPFTYTGTNLAWQLVDLNSGAITGIPNSLADVNATYTVQDSRGINEVYP